MSVKVEYPPLLPAGFHRMTFAELKVLCVDKFPLSKTRQDILNGLEEVIKHLTTSGVSGELWIDGSFLTEKIDPKDSDVVFCVSGVDYDSIPKTQRDIIDWLNTDEPRNNFFCDGYVHLEYPAGHQWYNETSWMRAYWIKQFGFSRADEMKGMALIQL